MKQKSTPLAAAAIALAMSIATSCSNDKSNPVTTDSLASEFKVTALSTRDTTPVDTVREIAPFPMSSQGVDNVRIGSTLRAIPDSIPGLYQKVVRHAGTALLVNNDTTVIIVTAGGDDRSTITSMEVTSPMVRVSVGGKPVAIGDDIKPLTKNAGFRHYPMTDTTEEYYLWRNIRLIPSTDDHKVNSFVIGD